MPAQLGSLSSPRGQVYTFICVCIYCQSASHMWWPEWCLPDFKMLHICCHRWCRLCCSHSSCWNGDLNCFINLCLALSALLFLFHHINLHPSRLSLAVWAPASSSPAALLPTRLPSGKRWRFTICWLWINTPLKVRQQNIHFDLN